jgi:hypothetical protein
VQTSPSDIPALVGAGQGASAYLLEKADNIKTTPDKKGEIEYFLYPAIFF